MRTTGRDGLMGIFKYTANTKIQVKYLQTRGSEKHHNAHNLNEIKACRT
jgi:hypothetical protein